MSTSATEYQGERAFPLLENVRGYGPKSYNGTPSLDPSKVSIWASLIMRDEEKNIPNCFRDLIPLVDGFVISDTGSLDNSVQVARSSSGGKKLELFEAVWINYSHNRNLVLRRLDAVVKREAELKSGLDLSAPIKWKEYQKLLEFRWFALVTDLDNRFHHVDPSKTGPVILDRSSMVHDGYFVESRRGGAIYRTSNLLRIDPLAIERWCYVRSVHEYSDSLEPWADMEVSEIEGCYIDYGCSGFRSRDHARPLRDVIYLLHDQKLEPEDSRTAFYLAQSYNEAECRDRACYYYKKRAEMKGSWSSERYLSYLKLADLADRSQGDQEYLDNLYKGFELGLQRFEIGYRICEYYRTRDLHKISWNIGRSLLNVKSVDSSEFLVDQAVTEWKFWDILGVSAYYAGEKYYSYMLTLRALNSKLLTAEERKRLESNLSMVDRDLRPEEKERAKREASWDFSGPSNGVSQVDNSGPLYLKLDRAQSGTLIQDLLKALLVQTSPQAGTE